MALHRTLTETVDPTWSHYRDNFPRQVLGITRYLEAQIMGRLTGEYGFSNLRLYYEPYISMVSEEGLRLTDLAEALGITRQAANQTANQIEGDGYIVRVPDPTDGRAKRIRLTPRGIELRQCGLAVARQLESEIGGIIGKSHLRDSVAALIDFGNAKGGMLLREMNRLGDHGTLVGLLPRFSDYTNQRLMELTIQRGHAGLKRSYAQVLALIGPEGGRILQIAALNNVSKQAISAIANELEHDGYIYRQPDPRDARQILLRFTEFGRKLIEDSVMGINVLETEIRDCIGAEAFDRLRSAMQQLYHALQPEVAVFSRAPDVEQLASELKEKLSREARQQLAALLLEE